MRNAATEDEARGVCAYYNETFNAKRKEYDQRVTAKRQDLQDELNNTFLSSNNIIDAKTRQKQTYQVRIILKGMIG